MSIIFEQVTGGASQNLTSARLATGARVTTKGYYSADDGGGDEYLVFEPTEVTANELNKITLLDGRVAVSQDKTGDIRKYGAKNGELSTGSIEAAIDALNFYYVPAGLSFYCLNAKHKNNTKGVIDGELRMPNNSTHWDSILVNEDTVNGNTGINLSGKGALDGNAENQTKIGQYLAFFYKCSNCNLDIANYRNNFGPDPYTGEPTPPHPLGPFDGGVPFGENSLTRPPKSTVMFIYGKNNHVRNFSLTNWAREGIFHWFCTESTISNFTAINGIQTDNQYYAHVDFGSLNKSASVSVGSNVHVDDSHEAGGQPWLIYSSLVSGVLDLSAEDYSNAGRWTLVSRDITYDYGYTAARSGGGGAHSNTIENGIAKYCRASSYSTDGLASQVSNVISYHNSYQVGINFGHDGSPASGSLGTGLISINAGWAGGISGSSYGINIVGASKNVSLSNFMVVGAGRAGINISSNGNTATLTGGSISYSAAQGVNAFAAGSVIISNVRAINNISGDFVAGTDSVLSLSNCEDTAGVIVNQQTSNDTVARNYELTSRDAKLYTAMRGLFFIPASTPIATITFEFLTSNDNMTLTCTYSERNAGNPLVSAQYAVEETVIVSGSGGSRNIGVLDTRYAQLRGFRYVWNVNVLEIYLTTDLGADVATIVTQNSLLVKAQSNANSKMRIDIG